MPATGDLLLGRSSAKRESDISLSVQDGSILDSIPSGAGDVECKASGQIA